MSEYQYYEFQAIDRPLTAEEQQAVAQLSSRVDPDPRQAVFVYHWSGFRGNSREILVKYYDAMLYMANWGSRRLMFRFPVSALDLEEVQVYCQPLIVQDYVSLSTEGEYAILNVEFHLEDSYDWVEGKGWLPAMLSLRDDILQGDYRMLYVMPFCYGWPSEKPASRPSCISACARSPPSPSRKHHPGVRSVSLCGKLRNVTNANCDDRLKKLRPNAFENWKPWPSVRAKRGPRFSP